MRRPSRNSFVDGSSKTTRFCDQLNTRYYPENRANDKINVNFLWLKKPKIFIFNLNQ